MPAVDAVGKCPRVRPPPPPGSCPGQKHPRPSCLATGGGGIVSLFWCVREREKRLAASARCQSRCHSSCLIRCSNPHSPRRSSPSPPTPPPPSSSPPIIFHSLLTSSASTLSCAIALIYPVRYPALFVNLSPSQTLPLRRQFIQLLYYSSARSSLFVSSSSSFRHSLVCTLVRPTPHLTFPPACLYPPRRL